ncbi:MAG: response regulator transcription factor [Chloroflexi bacterium]|nr:response regulator transcription factor [Chloroflexota bacterium]
MEPLKILIVDDHEVVRKGLRSLLGRRFQIVGEAATMADALRCCAQLKPNVVVMDIRLSDGSGVEACRAIRAMQPTIQVLMLTSYADDEALIGSILAGASGYILKQTRGRELVRAIETVGAGGSLLDPAVTQKVFERLQRASTAPQTDPELATLTEQEQRVLALLAEGKTNKQIASVLSISEITVKHHVSNILGKLHLSRRGEAAAFAARHTLKPKNDEG